MNMLGRLGKINLGRLTYPLTSIRFSTFHMPIMKGFIKTVNSKKYLFFYM